MANKAKSLHIPRLFLIVIWAAVIIVAGIIIGVVVVSCTGRNPEPAETATIILPDATDAEAQGLPPTETIAPTLGLTPEASPTPPTPLASATIPPAVAASCVWPPERVLVISVDALRPDAVKDTIYAPFMLDITKRGSASWDAQTISPSITLPGHLSMLSGYDQPTHGILDNTLWQTPEAMTTVTTIFQRAKEAGLVTALLSGKGHLYYISRVGFLDYEYINKAAKDKEIADNAINYIQNNDFDLMFINLANVDKIGHEYEWMSEEYLLAVGRADNAIQRIFKALETKGVLDSTLIIVNSDHGGTGISHGDATIPTNKAMTWMIIGPCVNPAHVVEQQVRVFDTAAMALWGLGIEIPADLDGKLVCEVFGQPVNGQCLEAQPKP